MYHAFLFWLLELRLVPIIATDPQGEQGTFFVYNEKQYGFCDFVIFAFGAHQNAGRACWVCYTYT